MSSRSPCVAAIIEKSTAVAMKWRGGKRRASIQPFPLVPYGCKVIHYRWRAATLKARQHWINELVGVRINKRSQILKSTPNDIHQTDRGQPSQLSQEHRSQDGCRKADFSLQCLPSWADVGGECVPRNRRP